MLKHGLRCAQGKLPDGPGSCLGTRYGQRRAVRGAKKGCHATRPPRGAPPSPSQHPRPSSGMGTACSSRALPPQGHGFQQTSQSFERLWKPTPKDIGRGVDLCEPPANLGPGCQSHRTCGLLGFSTVCFERPHHTRPLVAWWHTPTAKEGLSMFFSYERYAPHI